MNTGVYVSFPISIFNVTLNVVQFFQLIVDDIFLLFLDD